MRKKNKGKIKEETPANKRNETKRRDDCENSQYGTVQQTLTHISRTHCQESLYLMNESLRFRAPPPKRPSRPTYLVILNTAAAAAAEEEDNAT